MSTKPISTSELSGITLAFAIGTTIRLPLEILPSVYGTGPRLFIKDSIGLRSFRPDRDPALAWSLLCKHGQQARLRLDFHCNAASCLQGGIRTGHTANRMLTAALRALVTHLHGHAIEIPIELIGTDQEGAA